MGPTRPTVARVPDGAFLNDAGWIANIAFGEYRCVSLIWSVAGSHRSKHWHRTDSHLLYVLSGGMYYWERALDGEYGPARYVAAGESIETGPNVVHQCYCPLDTLLVSASANPRDHASHEADVVRVEEPWNKP